MAKYQAYAEYKDSGVEWLGDIPKEWIPIRLKHLLLESLVYGANEAAEDDNPKNPRYIRITDMNSDGTLDPNTFRSLPLHLAENYLLKDGDILLARSGATVGKSFYYRSEFGISCFAGYLIRARVHKSKLASRFAYWFFQSDSYWKYVSGSQIKATIQNVSAEKYGDLYLSLPLTINEQTKIANFLDHETAKIDSLIAKQEKLIELLKEKRQAVISHAVTKGLNPNVPMKDSGVAWLGEVPEHWQLVPLKYLCTFSGGGTPTKDNLSYWTDGNIPWVSPKDMKTFWISETQDYITEKAVKESSTNTVEQNSLLMVVRSGILQRTIPIAINTVPVTMNQDMKALKFGKRVLVEYIANLIHGNTVQLLLEWSKEGATVESIEHEYLANSLIPVPSLKEQEEITQVIAKKMKVYAELTEKAELQITLLKERRTALVSAAVTGKIDVRNWQAPTVAETHTELSA
ncbi:restriction endonuclease subunit S [Acinetobacter indicus]|uniref:restriction endonuclease subunit S n=1 Tax=Acinetobacter indicus TaxID=756892 RepID=UPI002578A9D0|nr:restriction endonuclease subunit S [Acinetobacter indicus]MDM1286687.1 restriction endonuclease subunit S [Acinetobacter indicus]